MKLRLYSVLACLCAWAATAAAQLPTPAQAPDVSAPKATDASPQVPSGAPRPPREVASRVNDGMGFSVEPIFWKARTFPEIREGATYFHIASGDLKYPSTPERAIGGRVSIPIGTNGTLRGSFIQMKSTGATVSQIGRAHV